MSADVDPSEVEQIRDMLGPDEEVLLTAKQSRMKSGGSRLNPSTVYATSERLIIRKPGMMSHGDITDFSYDQIVSVNLKRGMMSSQVIVSVPGTNWDGIPAISSDKAKKLHEIIRKKVAESKNKSSGSTTIVQQNQQSPADALKMRFIKGEITKEEFEEMKKALE